MTALLNIDDYERAARERLEASIYDYIAGGAWDEVTLRENCAAYDRWRFRPRFMVNVEKRDLSVSILGNTLSLPIGIAPRLVLVLFLNCYAERLIPRWLWWDVRALLI
jgi:4-hydroxymandelate oxidase